MIRWIRYEYNAFAAVVDQGAGKSASLNSLIGHPVLVLSICPVLLFFYLISLYLPTNPLETAANW